MGGSVAAEHGIGKTKRYLMPIQHPPAVLAAMRAVKRALDPHGILAAGNLL
jgi:FAD/FMN-containing dehydrogenase